MTLLSYESSGMHHVVDGFHDAVEGILLSLEMNCCVVFLCYLS